MCLGCKPGHVDEIARRNISDEERVLVIANRLSHSEARTECVNQPANEGASGASERV